MHGAVVSTFAFLVSPLDHHNLPRETDCDCHTESLPSIAKTLRNTDQKESEEVGTVNAHYELEAQLDAVAALGYDSGDEILLVCS